MSVSKWMLSIVIASASVPAVAADNYTIDPMPHPMFRKEVCGADAEGDLNWSEYGMK